MSTFVAATVMLTGAACATSATSGAIVGDVSITEQSIFDQTAEAVADQSLTVAQLAFVNRLFTTQDIRSALLEQVAKERGVVVTDAQVNAAMAGSTSGTRDARSYRELLLLEALLTGHGAEPIAYTNVTVTVDGARTSTQDEALEIRRAILARPAGAALPALDASATPFQGQTLDLSAVPDQLIDGVLSARPGDVLINQGSDGYYVIRVTDRSERPAQVTATSIFAAPDLAMQRQVGEVALLQEYAQHVGVSVNPRMGVWDPVALQVVATPTAS